MDRCAFGTHHAERGGYFGFRPVAIAADTSDTEHRGDSVLMRGNVRQLAAAILAGSITGCMLPVYHQPAGYSGSYHEHLRAKTAVVEFRSASVGGETALPPRMPDVDAASARVEVEPQAAPCCGQAP